MITEKEIIRYLGFGRNIPDERTMELIHECSDMMEKAAAPRHVYRRMGINITPEDYIMAEGLNMHSRNLSKNLRGCGEIILFAATLGTAPDMLMNRYGKLSVSRAAVLQACGAAMIEDYCNQCQLNIEEQLAPEGLYLRPRFSPGYGDLSLEHQKAVLKLLNAHKTIGVYLSDGGVMIPEKSVTAIMGISRENNRCHIEGCEACDKINCDFRRES
ncbi:MAG: Vitamin B12 dependent methionine synthase activation subunit [Butyrivibrio sp.]